ncbi:DUF7662 domain-containing protein [Bradyrhizobium sp. HKCCYLRH2015]|uniref:DUF7662 domain-containing protein n=1 Tax=unclassified Bradyrhizobium TaxID=2631580 RepID=UPI002915FA3F|nr:hypothetical protein [Bradyrhizobium sp. SZCCHNR1015]
MSLYDPIKRRLQSVTESQLILSFDEMEQMIGQALPSSARNYDAWWSNEGPDRTRHVQSKAWTTLGFSAEVDRVRRQVTFRRR